MSCIKLAKGLTLTYNDDGFWFNFDSGTGSKAMLNMTTLAASKGSVTRNGIMGCLSNMCPPDMSPTITKTVDVNIRIEPTVKDMWFDVPFSVDTIVKFKGITRYYKRHSEGGSMFRDPAESQWSHSKFRIEDLGTVAYSPSEVHHRPKLVDFQQSICRAIRLPSDAIHRRAGLINEMYGKMNSSRTQESAAVTTLTGLGYTWCGGEQWKPPIGKPWVDLTKLDTPFGELDRATQLRLVEHVLDGGDLDVCNDAVEWNQRDKKRHHLMLRYSTKYRAVPPKPTELETLEAERDELDKRIAALRV